MNTALQALRSFLSALSPPSERDNMEAYLAQSQSLADLEQRERDWHRASADRALMSIGVRSH
jgi:Protein of unknown function (DUF3563)